MLPAVPALLTFIILLTAVMYLRGWHQSRISAWRAASFLLGLLCTWIAVASAVAFLDDRMLTAHMLQHLLLMTFAPPLLWLGEPVKAMLRYLPRHIASSTRASSTRAPSTSRGRVVAYLGSALGDPVFCWLAAAAALVVWHVPALFQLAMHSQTWHLFEQASFLAAGLLFWWPVVQPWPSLPRWPRWSMLVYLFLATLPCDVLSGLLVFSDRIAYPMYLSMPRQSGLSVLEDQQCAAALMWTCVTVVFLVTGTVISVQLLSPRISRAGAVERAAV